jgi:hypothetical protein
MTTPSDLNIYQLIDTQNGSLRVFIPTRTFINWSLSAFSVVAGYFSPTKARSQNPVISLTPTWEKMRLS